MMSLRSPGKFSHASLGDDGFDALGYEILAEKAASLGRAGRRAESSLAKLRDHNGKGDERVALVRDAAEAVYAYFIQRELCGLRRHDDIIREFAIPKEVLARLGAK
jgi:Family of unknown function (DUF6665)